MTSPRFAAGQLRRRGTARIGEVRAARRGPSAQSALIVTVAVVICAGLAGGQAQAASAGPSLPKCIGALRPNIQISPNVIGQAQLPATFTTTDQFFAASGANYDVFTLDCKPLTVGSVTEGETNYVTFTGPAGMACGPHYFDDKYFAGGPTPDQEFFGGFTVSCITANPGTITAAQQPAAITVTGSVFFQDFNSFTVDIDGTPVSSSPTFNGDTMTTVITAQGLACGTHTITVNEKMGGSGPLIATAPLTVIRCTQPTLTANPTVVVDGMYTHVTGTGFVPNQPVALTWQTPAGATLTDCSPTADSAPPLSSDAKGAVDTFCFAPPHVVIGAAQIVATQNATQDGIAVTDKAAAPVVVEGGSMQPSSGSDELIFRH